MGIRQITSLEHPSVKHWTHLREDRKYRLENQRLLVMGQRLIQELSKSFSIQALLTLKESIGIPAQEHYIVTESILKKITGLLHPDGFAAELSLPMPQDLSAKNRVLILDQISDPGNLGTLLRTALALNWEGVICTPGTVDLFNDKALRAAKGATFHLPYSLLPPEEIIAWVQKREIHPFLADTKGAPLGTISLTPPLALILSSESQGPAIWTEKIARKITISMKEGVESLNVATSGAILLYAMRPLQ